MSNRATGQLENRAAGQQLDQDTEPQNHKGTKLYL